MIRDHTVAACSEEYNKSIIELLAILLGEPVYSTALSTNQIYLQADFGYH